MKLLQKYNNFPKTFKNFPRERQIDGKTGKIMTEDYILFLKMGKFCIAKDKRL